MLGELIKWKTEAMTMERLEKDMRFYRTDEKPIKRRLGFRWVAVSAISAMIGAATTAIILPVLNHSSDVVAAESMAQLPDVNVSPVVARVNVHVKDAVVQAVKKAEPAVMGVVNYAQISDFFTQQTKIQAAGVGTGVLFRKDAKYGYLVTNNHVVQGAAKVEAVMGSGKHIPAAVVGTDPFTDLAVLKVPVSTVQNISPAQFANSDNVEVGEPAIAIGTPMGLDFADSVTAGIISAKKRIMPVQDPESNQTLDYQAVIQTDAAINPGNSGGPLINIDGKVVGINSSKIVAQSFEGMGFAIPSNEVRSIADQIMASGHALHPSLGIMGYSLSTIPEQWWPDVPVNYGVWVRSVTSPEAQVAGLRPQDVIVGINGHDVRTMADLRTYLFQVKPGDTAALRVYRGDQQVTLKVKIGEMKSVATANAEPSGDGTSSMDPFSDFFGW
jgi:serine protease Do